jgi:uncharacterized membrane protein
MPGLEKGLSPLQKRFRIIGNVEDFKGDYQQVVRLHTRIRHISNILEPSKRKTSESVEKRLSSYLKETEKKLIKEDAEFIDNLLRFQKQVYNPEIT